MKLVRFLFVVGVAFGIVSLAFGQPKLEFEAASVRLATPGTRRVFSGGPGTQDPGRYTAISAAFKDILVDAFGLIVDQISGPAWTDTERYDITAIVPEGATKEQFRVMLQKLLAERFHLIAHLEKRDAKGYEMTVAKGGIKMKESDPNAPESSGGAPARGAPKLDKDGFPVLEPGTTPRSIGTATPAGGVLVQRITATQQSMAAIAKSLQGRLGPTVRIVDKTGLMGKYDFHLMYGQGLAAGPAAGPAGPDEAVPDLITAVQQQFGLHLEKTTNPA